jgi:hypothetical protein
MTAELKGSEEVREVESGERVAVGRRDRRREKR